MSLKVMYQNDRAQLFAGGNAGDSKLQEEMLVIVSGTGKTMVGQGISSIN